VAFGCPWHFCVAKIGERPTLRPEDPMTTKTKQALVESLIRDGLDYSAYKAELLAKFPVSESAGSSLLGRVKSFLKRFNRLYNFLVVAFGPVLPTRKFLKARDRFLSPSANEVVLNLGCGPSSVVHQQVLNADIFPFNNVDLVCDAETMPLRDDCVDKIMNLAMLEHVRNPIGVVAEMYRVMRPGGEVLCYVPFLQPFHAAPHDYQRWTAVGAKELFSAYSSVEVSVGAGSTSALLWVFLEWLSTLLSLGSQKLKDLLFMVLMVLLSPIKLLDLFLELLPGNQLAASGFFIVAKK
jgi:SAM-dependent methyltransferase